MAKSQTNQATSQSNQLFGQANQVMPGVISGLQGRSDQSWLNEANLYNSAVQGFQNQQTTGGYDPTQLSNIRGELSSMAPTGGYDPTQLAQTLGGYSNLATTGGYTPQLQQAYMNQATAGNPILAANLASAAQRNAAATGGNAQAGIANIQQQLGEQQAQTTNAAQLGLQQQITANQLQGLGGLQSTEQQLAAARQGITGQQTGLESGVASGVQGANAGLSGMYGTQASQADQLSNQVLQGLGLQFGTESSAANIMQQLSKNPGLFQTALGDIAQIGGMAAGAATGLGGLGWKPLAGCWIAEAVYGIDDPRTNFVRSYLYGTFKDTILGKLIVAMYNRFGPWLGVQVSRHNWLRGMFKPALDVALRKTWAVT